MNLAVDLDGFSLKVIHIVRGLGIILVSSLAALIKYPDKNNLGDKGLILAQSCMLCSIIVWKSQQWELEGVDKIIYNQQLRLMNVPLPREWNHPQ